jgi:anti-sigma regulatory factor (Ser/Thr protein kinase)
VSFASTLYLEPILEDILLEVPQLWQPHLKLGLQEALVNAVKHGNGLDPAKSIIVEYSVLANTYWWSITDEGNPPPNSAHQSCSLSDTIDHQAECGRGFYILRRLFDEVHWHLETNCLTLCKYIDELQIPLIY